MSDQVEPSRGEVRRRLMELLAGRLTREEVADWACIWVLAAEPDVQDPVVWEALKQLSGADLRESPVDYLHSDADFHEWLDRVEGADAL